MFSDRSQKAVTIKEKLINWVSSNLKPLLIKFKTSAHLEYTASLATQWKKQLKKNEQNFEQTLQNKT